MNRENILRVADAIEKHEIAGLGFNMSNWFGYGQYPDNSGHNCGNTACIAGWAAVVANPERNRAVPGVTTEARRFLDIDFYQERALFTGSPDHVSWRNVNVAQAVRTLRHLAATGEVNWNLSETTP